jgi:MraZ protein
VVKGGKFSFTFTASKKQLMNNLFGVYECNADEKGRVMLPIAFKKQLAKDLQKGFVLKRNIFSKSLELFPMDTWNEMSREVNKLNRFIKKNVEFIRIFNAGVVAVELDSAGRLLVSKELMAYAGIKKSIVMSAAVDRIEIWDKKQYEKFLKENQDGFEKLTEEVMGGITFPSDEGNKK